MGGTMMAAEWPTREEWINPHSYVHDDSITATSSANNNASKVTNEDLMVEIKSTQQKTTEEVQNVVGATELGPQSKGWKTPALWPQATNNQWL